MKNWSFSIEHRIDNLTIYFTSSKALIFLKYLKYSKKISNSTKKVKVFNYLRQTFALFFIIMKRKSVNEGGEGHENLSTIYNR